VTIEQPGTPQPGAPQADAQQPVAPAAPQPPAPPSMPVDRSPNAPQPPAPKRPIWIYLIGLAVVALIAVAIVGALKPGDPEPACDPDVVLCPDPPPGGGGGGVNPSFPPVATVPPASLPPGGTGGTPGPVGDPFLPGTTWTSTDLGFSVSYDPERWKVYRESGTDLVLVPQRDDFDFWVLFEGAKASEATVGAMIKARLDLIRQDYPGLEVDDDPYTAVLGPHIGYVDGEGASYLGTGTGSDGQPLTPTGFAILGATDGKLTVAFTMGVGSPDKVLGENTRQLVFRSWGDTLLKDFRWPS
jgi:hypothetical protein